MATETAEVLYANRHRDAEKGTGRTTRQMQAAPKGAVYVWPSVQSLAHAYRLALRTGRDDLQIVPPGRLRRLRGAKLSGVVLDHAAPECMTDAEFAECERLLAQSGG